VAGRLTKLVAAAAAAAKSDFPLVPLAATLGKPEPDNEPVFDTRLADIGSGPFIVELRFEAVVLGGELFDVALFLATALCFWAVFGGSGRGRIEDGVATLLGRFTGEFVVIVACDLDL
jgi:hypothetical protein